MYSIQREKYTHTHIYTYIYTFLRVLSDKSITVSIILYQAGAYIRFLWNNGGINN